MFSVMVKKNGRWKWFKGLNGRRERFDGFMEAQETGKHILMANNNVIAIRIIKNENNVVYAEFGF